MFIVCIMFNTCFICTKCMLLE